MFAVDSSDLDEVFVSDGLEEGLVPLKLWEPDVDGGSHGSAKVSWARGNVTEVIVVSELADLLNLSGSSAKSVENFLDTSSLLHGDDSELIFFVDPDEESLFGVVENSSSGWPVSVEIASDKESVSLPI